MPYCNSGLSFTQLSVRYTISHCYSCRIGLGIALKYLSEGHDVLLVGRSLDRLKGAIPSGFEGTGRSLFLAKDVSTVCAAQKACSCLDWSKDVKMTRAETVLPLCSAHHHRLELIRSMRAAKSSSRRAWSCLEDVWMLSSITQV